MHSPSTPAAPTHRLRAREGFALAMTLGAIVIIGTLIAGTFYLSTQQGRLGRSALLQERAFRYAEAGLSQVITTWTGQTALGLATGAALAPTVVPLPNVPVANQPTVRVSRLNDKLWLVTSEASVGEGASVGSRRRVSQVVRMVGPTFNFLGALTVRGNTAIGGSSQINGTDVNPTAWSCNAPKATMPGIAINDPSLVDTKGCTDSKVCVQGDPAIKTDPTAAKDSTYFKFGDADWDALKQMATLKMTDPNPKPAPALTAALACNTAVQSNWGDIRRLLPAGGCEPYFPIIYFPSDAKIQGGSGQGILMVEGDLEISGGFEFFGPVIVRGRLKTTGTGGKLNGGVMAANVDLEQNTVLGDAIVTYSSCAIEKAVQAAGVAKPITGRSWAEIF